MRNLDECRAEVFRRSEKRIKERKQRRNRILMACLPVAVCISLFSAFILPEIWPIRSAESAVAEDVVDGMGQNMSQSIACQVTEITVSGRDFSRSYTATSDVLQIYGYLSALGQNGIFTNGTSGAGMTRGDENKYKDVVYETVADTAGIGYTITLIMDEDKRIEYTLTGSTLKDMTTDQIYTLSKPQLDELKDLLGIPNP